MSLGGTDLNLVIALKALLEEDNVTKAGAKIGKSQPAMSTALARLRRHHKDELLVRVGRDYELTPFARALIPSVQQTVSSVECALDIGRRFDVPDGDGQRLEVFLAKRLGSWTASGTRPSGRLADRPSATWSGAPRARFPCDLLALGPRPPARPSAPLPSERYRRCPPRRLPLSVGSLLPFVRMLAWSR